jgi:hypothetical protein
MPTECDTFETGKLYSQRCTSLFGLHPSGLTKSTQSGKGGSGGALISKSANISSVGTPQMRADSPIMSAVSPLKQAVVINIVVPADMSTFHAIQNACGVRISEMPMSVFDLNDIS